MDCRRKSIGENVSEFWPGWAMEVLLQVQQQLRKKDWRGLYIHGQPGVGKIFIFKAAVAADLEAMLMTTK